MRKALLVLAMVAASFAGGAAVNGPGLAWFRTTLGLDAARIEPIGPNALPERGPESDSEPEPSSTPALGRLDDPPAPAGRPRPSGAPDRIAGQEPADPKPAAEPPRPLDLGGAPTPRTASEPPAPAPTPGVPTLDLSLPAVAGPGPATPRQPGWGDPPGAAPSRAFLPAAGAPAPRLEPAVAPAGLSAPALKAPGDPAAGPEAPPAVADTKPEASPTAEPEPEPESGAPAADWDAIGRRMAERGVTRFWVEGEPDGPARFRCVVPLTGRGAVAQHFEAEADDLPAAAEAALRRIDLWRATETP